MVKFTTCYIHLNLERCRMENFTQTLSYSLGIERESPLYILLVIVMVVFVLDTILLLFAVCVKIN